jgi:hypothetical protein
MDFSSSPTRGLLPEGLEAERLVAGPSGITVHARTTASCARCPVVCERRSQTVHIATTSVPSTTFPGAAFA